MKSILKTFQACLVALFYAVVFGSVGFMVLTMSKANLIVQILSNQEKAMTLQIQQRKDATDRGHRIEMKLDLLLKSQGITVPTTQPQEVSKESERP